MRHGLGAEESETVFYSGLQVKLPSKPAQALPDSPVYLLLTRRGGSVDNRWRNRFPVAKLQNLDIVFKR